MSLQRQLIVNADDFGLSAGVNRGIIRSHECGIVTSASLMVRWPAASEAAVYARSHPALSVGLHLDLVEWRCAGDVWRKVYEVADSSDATAVAHEVKRQLERFRTLVGGEPSHLDSHQHVHRDEPLRSVLREVAETLGIPLRGDGSRIRYCGSFYGQSGKGFPFPEGISVDALMRILNTLPEGCTELGCHPGEDPELDSAYRTERMVECDALCDPRVKAALADGGIQLCSFLTWQTAAR